MADLIGEKPQFGTEPSFIYGGAREIRRSFIDLLCNCFKKLQLTESYRWTEDNNTSKLNIASVFSDETQRYPQILVDVAPYDFIQTGFSDISKRNTETGDLYYSGQYGFTVTIRIADYSLDVVEDISDLVLLLLVNKYIWDMLGTYYGIVLNPSVGIRLTTIGYRELSGTSRKEFYSTIALGSLIQWESKIVGPDIETITNETFVAERVDPPL
jgi:hypothetical protein